MSSFLINSYTPFPTQEEVSWWGDCVFLCPYSGVDEATTATDISTEGADSPHSITFVNQAEIDTAITDPWGGNAGVLKLDGTTDYTYMADSADWYMASDSWTFNTWINLAVDQDSALFSQDVDANNRFQWFYSAGGGYIQLQVRTSGTWTLIFRVAWSPSLSTWYHLELARNSNTWYVFIDGVEQTKTDLVGSYSGAMPNLAHNMEIGGNTRQGSYTNGYMADVRFLKGTAAHTGNFTPPTSAYSRYV